MRHLGSFNTKNRTFNIVLEASDSMINALNIQKAKDYDAGKQNGVASR